MASCSGLAAQEVQPNGAEFLVEEGNRGGRIPLELVGQIGHEQDLDLLPARGQ